MNTRTSEIAIAYKAEVWCYVTHPRTIPVFQTTGEKLNTCAMLVESASYNHTEIMEIKGEKPSIFTSARTVFPTPIFPLKTPCKPRKRTRDQNDLDRPNPIIARQSPSGPMSRTGRRPIESEARAQKYTVTHSVKKNIDSW